MCDSPPLSTLHLRLLVLEEYYMRNLDPIFFIFSAFVSQRISISNLPHLLTSKRYINFFFFFFEWEEGLIIFFPRYSSLFLDETRLREPKSCGERRKLCKLKNWKVFIYLIDRRKRVHIESDRKIRKLKKQKKKKFMREKYLGKIHTAIFDGNELELRVNKVFLCSHNHNIK